MKKRTYFLSMLIMGAFLIVLGTSYALFRTTSVGEKDLVFETGNFEVAFQEQGNVIQLANAYPMTEQEGMKTGEYLFQVENRGTQLASYKIYLEEDSTITNSVSKNRLKIAWKKNDGAYTTPVFLSELENLTIESEVGIAPSKIDRYGLRIWLDESATNEEQGRTFKAKIVVEATQIISADKTLASAPELEDNMIPVKYDETTQNWIKADVRNLESNPWYQYQDKMWANAVTVDQNKVLDLSGNNNNGTVSGATLTSGQASFDGVDDYIDCGLEYYNFGSQQTMVLRIKIEALSQEDYTTLFANFEGSGSGFIYIKGTNELTFQIHNGTEYIKASVDYNLAPDQFYTLVGTYDGLNVKLYVDGVLIDEKQGTGAISTNNVPYTLGGNPYPSVPLSVREKPKMTTTDALIFRRALSKEEISTNYNSRILVVDRNQLVLQYDFKRENDIENGSPISMDAINTMMVWVPRYKYTMPAEKEGQIDIIFENNTTAKATGTATGTSYLTHPAFTFGKTELNGFWIGKFETSADITCQASPETQNTNCDLKTIKPQIKPNVKSWTGARISTFFTVFRDMQAEGNPYGYRQSGMNTHMMKNSEWGAVAYLTQSKYGRCTNGTCTEVTINNLNTGDARTITGCAGDTVSAAELKQADCPDTNRYNTEKGVLASTTGNIYGIYDMAGGDFEYVMANYNKITGATLERNSGFTGSTADGNYFEGRPWPEEKYYDLYTTTSIMTSCNGKVCLGHATAETKDWYSDFSNYFTASDSWINRGSGYYDGEAAGIFYIFSYAGISHTYRTTRVIVSKE